jgi:hypothetical protein
MHKHWLVQQAHYHDDMPVECRGTEWSNCPFPSWHIETQYRIIAPRDSEGNELDKIYAL